VSPRFASYDAALDYLFSTTDYERMSTYRYDLTTHDLARMEALLALLGDPHRLVPSIHIAGTKGKGSTAFMLTEVFRAAGLCVGLYTSPHLVDLRERIVVDGALISPEDFCREMSDVAGAADVVRERFPQYPPTFFEIVTALGFLHFARSRVDLAVVETGLGGRLDATNVVLPLVSVITTISIDHTIQLGNTVQSIAGEKAGIIKPGVPVVSGPQQPEAQAVIEAGAAERQAPLLSFGRDIEVSGIRPTEPPGLAFDVRTPAGWRSGLELRLLGPHQGTNAAVAVTAAEVAAKRGGLALPAEAVSRGLAETRAPGRVEFFPGEPAVILDAPHNPASTRALAEALRFHFGARPVVLLFGIAGDKDVPGTLREVLPVARALVATTNLSPRSAKPEEIARLAREGGCPEVHAEPDVPKAFALARGLCRPGELLVITGSFYLAGEVRRLLG